MFYVVKYIFNLCEEDRQSRKEEVLSGRNFDTQAGQGINAARVAVTALATAGHNDTY